LDFEEEGMTAQTQTLLILLAVLTWWLLPCAVQDRRARRVSSWLTVPAFFLAWPLALWLNTGLFTMATFIGFYSAFQIGGMGGADGKLAVLIAALAPPALLAGIAINGLAFLYCRWRGQADVHLPGVLGFYLGVLTTFAWVCLMLLIC
jgi:hypothetical protein